MKKHIRGEAIAKGPGLRGNEKMRMILMGVALLVLMAVFVGSQWKRRQRADALSEKIPSGYAPVEERVQVPTIDAAAVEERVQDARPEDRVLMDREGLALLVDVAQRLREPHFEAMGAEELDAERTARLLADPASERTKAFFARGWVENLRTRRFGDDLPPVHQGLILTEDETPVHFAVLELPERGVSMGSFVRLDGLFLKAYNREAEGAWHEGPLLVGPRLVTSYPALGDRSLARPDLSEVVDDRVGGDLSGYVEFGPKWSLLGHAARADLEAIDWEAAPELNKVTLSQILTDGEAWRGKPVRLPTSTLLATTVLKAGENPARLATVTDGWIGNSTWTGETGVIQFFYPGAAGELRRKHLVTGRGFFLKNMAYEPDGGGMRIAPVFVLAELERFIPPKDLTIDQLLVGVSAGTIGLILFFTYLVMRDNRRSSALQEKLVARRRARRAQAAT